MAFTECVVNFIDHALQRIAGVIAVPDTDRCKSISADPWECDQSDAAIDQIQSCFIITLHRPVAQGPTIAGAVIPGVKRHKVEGIDAEEGRAVCSVVEAVDIDLDHGNAVMKRAPERLLTDMGCSADPE